MDDLNLNTRQKTFCKLYVGKYKFNGAQAAIEAGYSKKTARTLAANLLANVNIAERVAELKKDLSFQIGIDARMIADEYRKIAFFNIKEIFNDDGGLKPINEISDDAACVINSIESIDQFGPDGESFGTIRKIKMNDKIQSLDKLSKMLGFDGVTKNSFTDTQGNDLFQLIFKKDIECEPINIDAKGN